MFSTFIRKMMEDVEISIGEFTSFDHQKKKIRGEVQLPEGSKGHPIL